MFNMSTRQPIVTFDRHNDDLSLVLQGFSKIEFMCFLKKQKHEKISPGVFTHIPAVRSTVSIIRHVHVLFCFFNCGPHVRRPCHVLIYFGSIPLD